MIRHFNIVVHGRVQGVFYRASAQQKALALGLSGWVCNQPDGSVYLEAEGKELQLQALIDWCKEGPTGAKVDQVSYIEGGNENFTGFDIRR